MPDKPGVQSLARAASVLRLLAEPHADGSSPREGVALAVVSRGTGLSPSTTHRILRSLVDLHLVEQDPVTERYRLGPLCGVLGQGYLASAGLERAQPILRALCRSTDESASLATLDGMTALVVLQEHSPQPLRVDHLPGKELFLHASAMGKVLLAFSDTGIDDMVSRLDTLERFTGRTITKKKDLVAELTKVAQQGYAVNVDERYEGASGVAVPILGGRQTTSFALGIQGPTTRLTPARIEELVTACRTAAEEIAALGL